MSLLTKLLGWEAISTLCWLQCKINFVAMENFCRNECLLMLYLFDLYLTRAEPVLFQQCPGQKAIKTGTGHNLQHKACLFFHVKNNITVLLMNAFFQVNISSRKWLSPLWDLSSPTLICDPKTSRETPHHTLTAGFKLDPGPLTSQKAKAGS